MSISVPNTTHSETEILFAVENFISSIFDYGFKPELKPEFKQLLELFDGIYNIDHYYFDYDPSQDTGQSVPLKIV